ncbi:hypothetical protein TN53_22095 [Streptomyces sp. WM6386]|nr:hypothetical protein TN53_22095 [Streptomyces sp. WM6386]
MTAAGYPALVKVRYQYVARLPMAPAAVAVVSKNASPDRQEFRGSRGCAGNEELSSVQDPLRVACPSTEAFWAPPHPPYIESSSWWANVGSPVSL